MVDAAQWQPALQAARSLRGEGAEMSGFSVELLEDGFRAVDPNTFVRYVVRRAPDGTPISGPRSKPPAREKNGGSMPPSPATMSDPPSPTKAARIAAMLELGAGRSGSKPPGPATESVRPEAAQKTESIPPNREPSQASRSTSQVPPRPSATPGVPRPNVSSQPPSASGRVALQSSLAHQAAPPQPSPALSGTPAGVSSEPLPPADLLSQREEDPSPSSPLTYRETVWVVPVGTSSDAAVRLLNGMFEGVRAALAGAKPGKLVNMAIFDHRFQGKPLAPPLATLTWKDWKDQGQGPEIRRPGDAPASMLPPMVAQAFAAQAPALAVPAAAAAPVILPTPPVGFPPPPVPTSPASIALVPPPAGIPPPAGVPPTDILPPPLVSSQQPASIAVQAPAGAAAPVAPAAPAPAVAAPTAVPSEPALQRIRTPAPSAPRIRLSGVELITDLFEALHDLHFLRDSLEGADFVLALVMEKLPSTVGLVHFYDIDAREFVIVRAVGPGASKTLQIRTSEKDALIAEAMRNKRAVVIDDATGDPRAQNGRWALIGSCRSLVCAPVEQGGRFLGLLELSNPRDGGPFQDTDGHALTYIGEQFAEFLATRGLILDPDRISGT